MTKRISPLWYPAIVLSSPILLPLLAIKNRKYKQNIKKASFLNRNRINNATKLELPELSQFELKVLVEQETEDGFLGEPGVSYLFQTERGSVLFDVGWGPENRTLAENAKKMDISMDQIDALAISHLHPDHMGGFQAVKQNKVTLPEELSTYDQPCYLPVQADAAGFQPKIVEKPKVLDSGIATTGPLARSLFIMGFTEEQALIARIKDKGLVIFTGCGHPTIEKIVEMVRKISDEPIYAIGGGLHFPITDSPLKKPGLKAQMIWGTGKPPWKRITDQDLNETIQFLNNINPQIVFLSAHDTCEHSISRLNKELNADTTLLKAGGVYSL
ncbi:MAG: MBL fold metallo-hydrolase [Candidatus Marinimicrobia bacterium]|nr:MBL fold metallo-hydrolase [Candidatus Neomarinimicrobiota bacterium]